MRSRPSATPAVLAIALFAFGPAQARSATVFQLHVCGSNRTVPLPIPARKGSDGNAPCHGSAAIPGDKKRLRSLC